MYFLVFFFFPGLILFSPFLNFRPKKRQIQA
jgi:NAD(P)H-quinone oxidoreductase subunit L